MTTQREIAIKAMQQAGILTISEQPLDEEINDVISAMTAMLGTWSTDEMLITARAWETFTCVGNQQTYTIGTGGDFDTSRPMYIAACYITSGSLHYTVDIIDDENFNAIGMPQLTGIPYYLNYDNGYPTGKIRLYYTPSQNYPIFLLMEKPLSSYTIDQTVDLPPGWEAALIFNLAVWICPQFGQTAQDNLVALAKETKGAIRTAINRNRTVDWQPSVGVPGNIYSGWYAGNC